jgi:hypothetical protein
MGIEAAGGAGGGLDAVDIWRLWITRIAADPEMDRDRLLRHIQLHVAAHMPNADAPRQRWERWLAGTYNLLAILASMTGCDPAHEVGVARLFRHWETAPTGHTPPPPGLVGVCRDISAAFK